MYAKMKELGPIGGHVPSTPPRSANACTQILPTKWQHCKLILRKKKYIFSNWTNIVTFIRQIFTNLHF